MERIARTERRRRRNIERVVRAEGRRRCGIGRVAPSSRRVTWRRRHCQRARCWLPCLSLAGWESCSEWAGRRVIPKPGRVTPSSGHISRLERRDWWAVEYHPSFFAAAWPSLSRHPEQLLQPTQRVSELLLPSRKLASDVRCAGPNRSSPQRLFTLTVERPIAFAIFAHRDTGLASLTQRLGTLQRAHEMRQLRLAQCRRIDTRRRGRPRR